MITPKNAIASFIVITMFTTQVGIVFSCSMISKIKKAVVMLSEIVKNTKVKQKQLLSNLIKEQGGKLLMVSNPQSRPLVISVQVALWA